MRLQKVKKLEKDLFALYVPRAQWLRRSEQTAKGFVLKIGFTPEAFGFKSIRKVRSLTTPSGLKKLYVRVEPN